MLYIRQGATHKVVIGPVVAVANGYVPVTTLDLTTADEAEVILHDNATVVDISGYTFAAITTADGYYHLTLQSGISNTVGHMTVVINDDSLCLPVKADFTVIDTAIYDGIFADGAAVIPANVTQIGGSAVTAAAGIPEVKVASIANNAITAASINADAITDAKVAADVTIASVTGAVGSVTGNVGGNVTGSVGSVAAGGIAAASFAAGAIDAASISADAGAEIADAILNRDMSTGTDSGSPTVRTVRQALRFLRNKWSIAGTTLTVTKEDDTTASWTSEITATAGADPITASDPASA